MDTAKDAKALNDFYKEMDFSAAYSENIPAVLSQLNISLAFTSYQAGRLMFIRSADTELEINYKQFVRPMGLVATPAGLTLGTFTEVLQFSREDGLLAKIKQPLLAMEDDVTAPRLKADADIHSQDSDQESIEVQRQRLARQQALYAPVDQRVDSCFIARSAHYSGMINIHDVDWGAAGLWVVNSSFSCLCTLEPGSSFIPHWKPFFISELVPEDRCHLNGMALKDGYPAFVTTFSKFNEKAKWRQGDQFDGTLMSVEQNEILLDGLVMPHSPRWYQGKVYFCNSGLGQLCCYDPLTGSMDVIAEVPGFTRGMAFYGSLLFLGLSNIRQGDVTRPAPLAQKYQQTFSGIWIFDLTNNSSIGHIQFSGNVDQIYDVAVITRSSFPELIEPNHPRMRNHFCFSDRLDSEQGVVR